jgi:hypothetical protein
MDMRRLPLLLLLVLLPVPAQADQHNVKCSTVISTEEEQSLAARLSCGVRLKGTEYRGSRKWFADGGNGTARSPATIGAGIEPEEGDRGRKPRMKRSLFLVAEAAEYIAGRDSGHFLDGWMIGLRYFTRGPSTIEPFFHVMGGRQRPSRRNTITAGDDAVTDWFGAAAFGGGVDLEINPLRPGETPPVIVPVLRLQLDLVKSWAPGVDPYGRATFGVSFRFE